MSFWHTLPQPIVGLSPMDGVTDAAFRYIVARHGKPDVQYTEFVSVDEITRGTVSAWRQLRFLAMERPIIAQIYGADPEKFYQAAHIICALGFDGVDINMGCPSKNVAARGCGAALIKTPELAQEIIRAVQAGVKDWASSCNLAQLGLSTSVTEKIQQLGERQAHTQRERRQVIPVSVKTRIGYDTVVVEEWVTTLLEVQPEVITLHGRTLAQLYRGPADWDAIRRAVTLSRGSTTLLLGNGDIRTIADAAACVEATQAHGVLIGRGALGNPWLFREKTIIQQPCLSMSPMTPCQEIPWYERLGVALEHACYFESLEDAGPFVAMRKHLGWYCRGFPGAAELRTAMFKTTSAEEVAHVFSTLPLRR